MHCNSSKHAISEHAFAMQLSTEAYLKQNESNRDVNGSYPVDVDVNLILKHLLRCQGGSM